MLGFVLVAAAVAVVECESPSCLEGTVADASEGGTASTTAIA